jgi:hypothetical protein
MRSSLVFLTLCACGGPLAVEDEVAATTDQAITERGEPIGIIIMNGLAPHELGQNLLLNDEARRALLINSKLETSAFRSGPLFEAVKYDPAAAKVLKYIVRCALGPTNAPVVANGATLAGQAGLCTKWATSAISTDTVCQQRVTACVLGLSNAANRHVPVSLRGFDPTSTWLSPSTSLKPSSASVLTDEKPRSLTCTTATTGVANDCGWQPVTGDVAHAAGIDKVFSCRPFETTVVSGGSSCYLGRPLGLMSPSSDKVLRVCPGPNACDQSNMLGQAQDDKPFCTSILPEVRFVCPESGTYTVMQRDYVSPSASPGSMVVGHAGAATGVATERAAFPVREGAFFGTIFTGKLGRTVKLNMVPQPHLEVTVDPYAKVVYAGLFACADPLWNTPDAYRTDRLCALSPNQCLSQNTGPCRPANGFPGACEEVQNDTPAGSGAFHKCKGEGVTYTNGLTTFLQLKCDLISKPLDCKRLVNVQ